MNLEKQVCSLENSMRLRELGVKQESLFWHVGDDSFSEICRDGEQIYEWEDDTEPYSTIPTPRQVSEAMGDGKQADDVYAFSAFTVAELGEMLPTDATVRTLKHSGKWYVDYHKPNTGFAIPYERAHEGTEADARAKMLVYLLENKLITL